MGGCGRAARSLLRLCAALLLALGLAMCIASAVLFAQWRAQASAGASGADKDAQLGAPWFLYCTFGAGAYVSITALFGLHGASPRRPRCLNAHVGLLVAGMVPQVAAATVLASDPALSPPTDATGVAARLAALDAAAARGLAFAAAALQLLALALAAALQPDGDDDASPADFEDEEGTAHAQAEEAPQDAAAAGGVAHLRAPLLPPRPSAGNGGALSADEWSMRMRTRYNLDTSALTYDPRRRGPPPPPPRRVQGPSAEYDRCSLQ